MEKITVELKPRLCWVARSPLYVVIAGLQGVAITFAPLFLYWCGKGTFYPKYQHFIVPLCFSVIFLVPAFYYKLGSAVIRELRRE
jgi:hypothetical protein